MVRVKCSVCGVFVRGRPRRVADSGFWKDFIPYMAGNHAGKPYDKQGFVCGRCHIKVRDSVRRPKPEGNQREGQGQSEMSLLNDASGFVQNEVHEISDSMACSDLDSVPLELSDDVEMSEREQGLVDRTNVYEIDTGNSIYSILHEIENLSASFMEANDSETSSESEDESPQTIEEQNSAAQNEMSEGGMSISLMGGSEVSVASSVYVLKDIETVGKSEKKCTVCGSLEGRLRIPKQALWQVWIEKQILIPAGNRTCSSHLQNSRFTETAIEEIESSRVGVHMSGTQLGEWILGITAACKSSKPMSALMEGSLSDESYKKWFGLPKADFEDLFATFVEPSNMRNSCVRHSKEALAMFLILLRKNLDQDTVGFMFNCSQSVVSSAIESVSLILQNTLVRQHLGFEAMTRDAALRYHMRSVLHDLLKLKHDEVAIIADGTYIYVEQPIDMKTQRLLYSGQKKRNLIKPMMLIFPSGYILDVAGPYGANGSNNDASIMEHLLLDSEMTSFLQGRDRLIVDRGFQNCKEDLENEGYGVYMPALLKKDQPQFTTLQANETRLITKNRWVVESVNARLKNVFPFFKHMIEGTYLPKIMRFVRIACALFNRYFHPIQEERPSHKVMVEQMLAKMDEVNWLQREVEEKNLEGRFLVANWIKASSESPCLADFPKLSMKELQEYFFGDYQLRTGLGYVKHHMERDGKFEIFVNKHSNEAGTIIGAKIQSRFRSVVKHQCWIKYNTSQSGVEAILGVYCKCQAGARTVGSCGHVAAVLRYLAYDRHEGVTQSRRRAPLGIIDAKARVNEIRSNQSQS